MRLDPGAVMTVSRDGLQLFAQLTGQPKFPHALGTAMKGLVTAEGNSQSMQSSATKQWSTQIGNAYRAAAHGP